MVNDDPYGEGWLIRIRPSDRGRGGIRCLDVVGYQAVLDAS